jgi:hypothetical protein
MSNKICKIVLSVVVLAVVVVLNMTPTYAESRKAVKPQIKMLEQPAKEYNSGDRVSLKVSAPNYSGKVEYRVMLWDGNKKHQRELWPSMPGYYYNKWTPSGNTVFTIGWPITEPGPYSLTVLVKRSGAKVSYDSYVKTYSFVVKPKDGSDKDKIGNGILDKEGLTYGPSDEKSSVNIKNDIKIIAKNINFNNAVVEGNVYISSDSVTLNNINIKGTLFVDPGESGQTSINNVTASNIKVLSGAQNSIHLNNVKSKTLEIESKNRSNPVRIETKGSTVIDTTTVNSNAILDTLEGSFGNLEISKGSSAPNIVELRGTFDKPIIISGQVFLKAAAKSSISKIEIAPENQDSLIKLEGAFKTVEINKTAKVELTSGSSIETAMAKVNAEINLGKDSVINTLDSSNYEVKVTGDGKIIQDQKPVEIIPPAGGGVPTIPSIPNPPVEEKLEVISAGITLSTGYRDFGSSPDGLYNIDISGEDESTRFISVSLKVSKDAEVNVDIMGQLQKTFILSGNKIKTFKLSDLGIPDSGNDGVSINNLKLLGGDIPINIIINDGVNQINGALNIKIK